MQCDRVHINMDNKGIHLDIPDVQTMDPTRKRPSARQDSSVDLWATVDRSRLEQDVHIIPFEELFNRFRTNAHNGLSASSIPDARAQCGANKLTPPKQPSYL